MSRDDRRTEVVTSYVAAGNYVGEMGLIGRTRRNATVRATVPTETISLDAEAFDELLKRNPNLREQVETTVRKRIAANARMEGEPQSGDLISFLMRQGLGEATDVLLIDETLCVRCDNCEKACAETHGGTSRLRSRGGPDVRARPRADLVPALRGPALHEGLPAGRDPPRAERRGLHPRQLHRLRQLRAQLPVRRDPHGREAAREARAARVAAVRARRRPGRSAARHGAERQRAEGATRRRRP